jgi:hypothetical protein
MAPAGDAEGGAYLRIAFPAPLGSTPVIESFRPEQGLIWLPEQGFVGNGFERTMDVPMNRPTRLFRVRK